MHTVVRTQKGRAFTQCVALRAGTLDYIHCSATTGTSTSTSTSTSASATASTVLRTTETPADGHYTLHFIRGRRGAVDRVDVIAVQIRRDPNHELFIMPGVMPFLPHGTRCHVGHRLTGSLQQ